MKTSLLALSAAGAAAALAGTSLAALRRPEAWVVLQLDPRPEPAHPQAIERLWHTLWGTLRRGGWHTWRRGPGRLSFELHVADQVQWLVAVPETLVRTVTRQLQATYPGLLVRRIPDPLAAWRSGPDQAVAAALVATRRPPAYPLEFPDGASPLAYLRAMLPPLPEGEEVWIQILARPVVMAAKGAAAEATTGRVAGLVHAGLEELQAGVWAAMAHAGVRPPRPGRTAPPVPRASATGWPVLTLERRHALAAAEKAHAATAFATVIRVVAAAPAPGRTQALVKEVAAALCWPAGPNALRARRCWLPGRAAEALRRRLGPPWGWRRCVLAPAELAPLAQVVPPPEVAQSGARVLPVEEDLP